MRSTITLKEFSAVSSGAVQVTHATASAIPGASPPPPPDSVQGYPVPSDKSDESFRQLLHQRCTAPLPCASPYQRRGTNE